MRLAVYAILFFEITMLLMQMIRLYEQPHDGKRSRYLVLLIILVIYNLCKIFLPLEQTPFHGAKLAITNTVTFLMTLYFGYFFYRAFKLTHIKFFIPNRALLSMPFVLLFVLPEFTESFRASITPFLFSFCIIWCASNLLMQRLKEEASCETDAESMKALISTYIAMVCWAVIPVFSSLGKFQAWDLVLVNVGFIGMTIVYVQSSVSEVRKKYAEVESLKHKVLFVHKNEETYSKYKFTRKEIEVANLIVSGHTSRRIADLMHISLHTSNKHISNIFRKVNVNSKTELIQKLNTNQTPL